MERTLEEEEFYKKAILYWAEIPPTIDGMLGGFGHISQIDIHGSRQFLKLLFQSKQPPGKSTVVDCGAGIGRITKHLLAPIFNTVDLVEQNLTFLQRARGYLGPEICQKVENFYNVGLQEFLPDASRYDVIWCQWVLGHLTDFDLMKFLHLASVGLKRNGMIIVKENVTSSDNIEVDKKDSSITRPYRLYMDIFRRSNLRCLKKVRENSFPKGLYTVYMFALRPQD